MLWPVTIVGGCIGAAALGVMILHLTGADDSTITAGSDPVASVSVGIDLADGRHQSLVDELTATTQPWVDEMETVDPGGDDPATRDADDDDDDEAPGSDGGGPNQAEAPSATPDSELGGETSIPPPAKRGNDDPATTWSLARFGVYDRTGPAGTQLGSYVVAGDHLVTSSSSVGPLTTVWLRSGDAWLQAEVGPADPLTDIALLTPVDLEPPVGLPPAQQMANPEVGAVVMVGYDTGIDGDAIGAPESPLEGSGDSPTPTEKEQPRTDLGTDILASPAAATDGSSERAWVESSPGRGWIYSLQQPMRNLAGRVVYEPIRTGIDRAVGDAGAPMRDASGRLIGMVLGTDARQMAALPIDRVIEIADSLQRWGVGNLAWIGVETVTSVDGLRVIAVDEHSPADQLSPGDLIVAVDGELVTNPDRLEHLVRRAGPDGTLALSIDRRGRRISSEVVVAMVPLP